MACEKVMHFNVMKICDHSDFKAKRNNEVRKHVLQQLKAMSSDVGAALLLTHSSIQFIITEI